MPRGAKRSAQGPLRPSSPRGRALQATGVACCTSGSRGKHGSEGHAAPTVRQEGTGTRPPQRPLARALVPVGKVTCVGGRTAGVQWRPQPQTEPGAPTPTKRAGNQALQGTIASPPHHEEWSSWRLSAYQASLAGASQRPGCPAPVTRLGPWGMVCGYGWWGHGPRSSRPAPELCIMSPQFPARVSHAAAPRWASRWRVCLRAPRS